MLNQLIEVFKCLNSNDVKYLVIGGIASILYGVPRATFDLDIIIENTLENAQRLLDALLKAGLGTASLTTADQLVTKEISIFKDKVRVDVQTKTPGIDFKKSWERCEKMRYKDVEIFVLTKDDLISSKKAAGRKIDLEDIKILEMNK